MGTNMQMRHCRGYTIVEIIVVVVILGIMASFAIPKVTAPNEKVLSSEGINTLIALLGAQKRYFIENDVYTGNLAQLDVDGPPSAYFDVPTAIDGTGGAVASIGRTGGAYTLTISDTGIITCAPPAGAGCAAARCQNGVGANRCN
jgi:type IV pilus assembly protein PilE